MPRRTLLTLIAGLLIHVSVAQHADLGTGALKNEIWWLNWSGVSLINGATNTVSTDDGLTIKFSVSSTSSRVPVATVMTSNYFGSMLHLLYDFSDPKVLPSLFDGPQQKGVCSYTMTVTASRNGSPVSFYLVSADAEASAFGETTTLVTNGGNWQTMTFFRNSTQTDDPLTGCGTQTVSIQNTFDGNASEGQNPIISTLSPGTGPLVLNVTLDHNGTTGGMGLAFGILQSEDRGDLPASYGYAQHQLLYSFQNPCSYLPPLPSLAQDVSLYLGAVPGDADGTQTNDDNAVGVDEEAVSTFPVYSGGGTYTLTFPVKNTTGSDAWLSAWFDYNRDGVFQPSEGSILQVPNNATTATVTWTGLPAYLPQGAVKDYGFRLRISSDKQAIQQSGGFAKDGEVEDYLVPAVTLCAPVTPQVAPFNPICAGKSTTLVVSGPGTLAFTWSPTTGLSNPNVAAPIAAPPATTTYTVTATNPQGCSGNLPFTLTVLPVPVIQAGKDMTICLNDMATLQASGGADYTWTASDPSFTATGPAVSVSPVQSTDYYVLGTGVNGCSANDTVAVTVHRIPVFATTPSDPSICLNDVITLKASGGDSYTWLSATGQVLGSTPSLVVHPIESTLYQVAVTDNICRYTQTLDIPVTVRPLPQLTMSSSNDIDCTVGQSTLAVTGARDYQWQPAPGITNLLSSGPVVNPLQTTTYYVQGTDGNGCSAIDSITVKVNNLVNPSQYPVPSAFTPNNDGHNDCFGLKYWGHVTSLTLEVFNRLGQRVFYTTNPQQCWDGTFKGMLLPAGTYVYQIRATTACGIAYRKGTVILVR